MKRAAVIVAGAVFALPQIGQAEVRELSQAELRTAIANDRAIASFRLIKGVEEFTGGSVVDVRAFDVDGSVTYRILVQEDDGGLGAIMLDGGSGQIVMPSTRAGRELSIYARDSTRSSSRSHGQTPQSRGNSNARNTGNDNNGNGRGASGNGRGNGGNGRGNGGGNNGNGGGKGRN